jgi:NADH:ubiquinone oxidoreductase subunit 3 (subunit A)
MTSTQTQRQKIGNNFNTLMSEYQNNLGVINQRSQALEQNYVALTQDRNQIEQIVREFETLNSAQENADINVTMNYYHYMIMLFIVLLLIFLLLRFSISGQQSGGKSRNFILKIFT